MSNTMRMLGRAKRVLAKLPANAPERLLLEVLPAEQWLAMSPKECARAAATILLREYLLEHPGAAHKTKDGFFYTDGFRRYAIALMAPEQLGAHLSASEFAAASLVPLRIVQEWLTPR